jgi:ankyrin repeat protein
MSPLHNAASDGHLEIVKLLLARGAYINVKNNDGDTPLISAAIDAAAIRGRLESSSVKNNERLCRCLEVVRVFLLVVGPSV